MKKYILNDVVPRDFMANFGFLLINSMKSNLWLESQTSSDFGVNKWLKMLLQTIKLDTKSHSLLVLFK